MSALNIATLPSTLKKILLVCLTSLFITACSTGVNFNPASFFQGKQLAKQCKLYQQLSIEEADKALNADIYQLQHNIERRLVFRDKIAGRLTELTKLTDQDKPFSPSLIDKLSLSIKKEIELIKPILATATKHGCWLNDGNVSVDPSIWIKGTALSLATLVYLYDEYGTIIAVVNENDRLRRFLNNADSGYQRDEYLLESLTQLFVDTDMLSYAKQLSEKYSHTKSSLLNETLNDDNLTYLLQVIEQSKSLPILQNMDYFDAMNHRRKIRRRVTLDTLQSISRMTVNNLSKGFSNTVGDYEDRKGLLYQDERVEHSLAKQLKIGDILLEKTPFRLTDSMIPGHWGHAAIWIGTEEELKAIDLWEHPLVVKYYPQIKSGKLIAESLRSGTQLNSLSHFMNVDDVAIVRNKEPLTPEALRNIIILALRQIGKAYDFNFDVETTDKIVCSQLVYLSYSHIDWPTESTLGRHTISPDNVAVKTFNDGPLDLKVLYHQGELVELNKTKLMQSLMTHH